MILILTLILLLCVCLAIDDNHHPFHWIFVHYHKTGHDLARKLSEVFAEHKACHVKNRHQFQRRISVDIHLPMLRAIDIAVMAAPDIQKPWNSSLLGDDTVLARFVHFLRDPYDMVMSGYLYHSQDEAPGIELWLKNPTFDPCAVDRKPLYGNFGTAVGLDYGDVVHVTQLLKGIEKTCQAIKTKSSTQPRGYNAVLRSLSKEDGVILEAARSILSATGGDILRMATNVIYQTNTINSHTYRVFLQDFSVGNRTRFEGSSRRMFSFLMSDIESHHNAPSARTVAPFWSCMTVDDAVHRAVELAYVSDAGSGGDKGVHVTQGMISPGERMRLVQHLRDHPSIGPLLDIVSDILQY